MTLHRGTFKIAINPRHWSSGTDSGERTGYVKGSFGIHGSQAGGFTITHLPSGYEIGWIRRLRDARSVLETLNTFAVLWDSPDPLKLISTEERSKIIVALRGMGVR